MQLQYILPFFFFVDSVRVRVRSYGGFKSCNVARWHAILINVQRTAKCYRYTVGLRGTTNVSHCLSLSTSRCTAKSAILAYSRIPVQSPLFIPPSLSRILGITLSTHKRRTFLSYISDMITLLRVVVNGCALCRN